MDLKRIKPIMPVGIKAAKIFFQTAVFLNIEFQNKKTIASIAPSWIIISKSLTKLVWEIFSIFDVKIMCPVEEIGRNSDMPSITDKIIASKKFTLTL